MIGIVLGTRPEIMKLAPVVWELERRGVAYKLVHTGQHYDYNMSRVFLDELGVRKPDAFLGIGSGPRRQQVGSVVRELGKVIRKEGITLVCVVGDTNSVMGAALAAKKNGCVLAHVEGGARSFTEMPEEKNRIATDKLSDVLFAPTRNCLENLEREGIVENVFLSGNTEVEALARALKKKRPPAFAVPRAFALATLHRQANAKPAKLKHLWRLFGLLKMPVVFLVHPRTEKALKESGLWNKSPENVCLEQPVGYFELLWLLEKSRMVLTDSGGLQVEAAVLGKPLMVLRDETEWVEIIKAGAGALVGLGEKTPALAEKFLKELKPARSLFKAGAARLIVSKLVELDEA